ncbi:MAG TPA: hypothetical protein H9915_04585 [Candidatus Gemmiger faecigallinarum]|nr:hypothetical protein [Candidatus Gemmiger faecigallinarum]
MKRKFFSFFHPRAVGIFSSCLRLFFGRLQNVSGGAARPFFHGGGLPGGAPAPPAGKALRAETASPFVVFLTGADTQIAAALNRGAKNI